MRWSLYCLGLLIFSASAGLHLLAWFSLIISMLMTLLQSWNKNCISFSAWRTENKHNPSKTGFLEWDVEKISDLQHADLSSLTSEDQILTLCSPGSNSVHLWGSCRFLHHNRTTKALQMLLYFLSPPHSTPRFKPFMIQDSRDWFVIVSETRKIRLEHQQHVSDPPWRSFQEDAAD